MNRLPMNRRQILQYTAWLTGGAVSTAFTGAFLSGCSDGQQAGRQPAAVTINGEMPILHFFTPEQFVLLTRLADTILPRTDSPSATDVKAHITLDSMVGQI